MSPSRREPGIDPVRSVRELQGSPPNAHRVCAHRDDVVWIAAGDARAYAAGGGAHDGAELARFVADNLRARQWGSLVGRFGLDFTIAASLAGVPGLLCTRGPAARVPLYVARGRGRAALTTELWTVAEPARPMPEFLRHVLASAFLPAPTEPDHTLETASPSWLRTPRGAVLAWRDGRARVLGRYGCPPGRTAPGLDQAVAADTVWAAIDERIRAVAAGRRFATELSGGIDSGIIAARSRALLPEQFAGGVTLVGPWHELRRERSFVDATIAHARTTTRFVDIEPHLPFSGLANVPVHDEPSLSVLAGSLLGAVFQTARELGVEVLCHGIGGDQVFADRAPSQFAALSGWRDGLDFADPHLRLDVRAARWYLRRLYFGGARCLRRSPAFLLHDGWYDRYLAPAMGLQYEGIFVDLQLLLACDAVRTARRPRAAQPPKAIARRAFAGALAPAVLARRGKAGFDGVYQRGLRRNIDEVCGLIDAEARSLADAGVNARRLIRRVRTCAARGWGSRDTPVFAALAWVAWMHALRREGRTADGPHR
jgi:asparagine synthetase B (glutamine-hydrolysing)